MGGTTLPLERVFPIHTVTCLHMMTGVLRAANMATVLEALYVAFVATLFLRYLGTNPAVEIGPVNPNDPVALKEGVSRHVLVVGGGLAGLSAALELAERGFNVTVKEAGPMFGGRLKSTEVELLGETFRVDHGFHAWFHNYLTFKDIRSRLGINHNFRPWGANHFKFRNHKPEVVESKGPYPLNVITTLLMSPNYNIRDTLDIIRISTYFAWYDHERFYKRYANITFENWVVAARTPAWFADTVLRPALSVTFNERTTLNAAELIMYSHFYFTGDAKADNREIATVDHRTAIFDPWIEKLRSLGARIQTKSPVRRLRLAATDDYVTGVYVEPETQYDHVILATDLAAAKSIFSETNRVIPSNVPVSCIQERLNELPLAPGYKVLRVWFDCQLALSHPAILQTPESHPVNLVVQYHLIEEKSREWSERTGGSIIEFHLYTWDRDDVDDDAVWQIITPTVKTIYPEIFERNFTKLGQFLHADQNFASFAPNLEHVRPTVTYPEECGLKNIFFAGDWLHTPYPSALMERAASTGRVAANQVLLSEHVRQAPLLVMSSYGPGYI